MIWITIGQIVYARFKNDTIVKAVRDILYELKHPTNGMSIDQHAPPSLQLICKAIF